MTTKIARQSYHTLLHRPAFLNAMGRVIPDDTKWQARHRRALLYPIGTETAIVGLLDAWAQYADNHAIRYESGVGEDGVLGPAWAAIGHSLRTMLNGETGRLDCGTLDGFICTVLHAEGREE